MAGRQAAYVEIPAACLYAPLAPLSCAFNADNTTAPASPNVFGAMEC
jgi:hypothetical protein